MRKDVPTVYSLPFLRNLSNWEPIHEKYNHRLWIGAFPLEPSMRLLAIPYPLPLGANT